MTVQRGSESRTRIAVASQGDRTRAFRRARVNTWFVRFVKIGLPLIAVIALAVYGGRLAGSMSIKSGPVSVSGITIDPENVVVDRPTYDGFAKDGSRYQIRAKSAAGDLRQTGPIKLTDITGDIFQPNGVVTRLTAVRGLYDSKKSELELFEAITIAGSNGLKARLTHAMIWNKEGRIVSKEPVVAELPTATINARSMEAFQKKREANFAGDVHVRMFPAAKAPSPDLKGAADAAAAVAVAKTPRGPGLPGTAMKSDAPIDVWSETLAVNDDAKTALFKTKVRAVQDAATLESQELEVHYTGKASLDSAPAGTKPKDETAGEAAKLKLLLGRGGVTMVSGPESRATSDDLSYDAESQIAILIGRVVMTSGADKRAVAARAEMDQLKDTALLVGGVHVVQSRNELWGERLMVDRKAGTMHLDSPAAPGKAAGRIKAHLVQTETPEAAARKAAAAAAKPATEAATASPLGVTFRTNPNAPIDIDADTLDANDKSKTAIFRGNVVSRQDEFVMKTPEMIAHYAGESGLASAGLVPSVPKKKGEGAQLTKVEARTKVFVTSKGGQTANGDWAIYDVKTNTVIVGGNVVVTHGTTVIKGPRLKIDMTTGVSNFEADPIGEAAAGNWLAVPKPVGRPALPPTAVVPFGPPKAATGRATMVLIPKDAQELRKPAKDKKGAGPAAAGPVPPAVSPAPAARPSADPAPFPSGGGN